MSQEKIVYQRIYQVTIEFFEPFFMLHRKYIKPGYTIANGELLFHKKRIKESGFRGWACYDMKKTKYLDFLDSVRILDQADKRYTNSTDNWADFIRNSSKQYKDDLEELIMDYSDVIGIRDVKAIENVLHSTYLRLLQRVWVEKESHQFTNISIGTVILASGDEESHYYLFFELLNDLHKQITKKVEEFDKK